MNNHLKLTVASAHPIETGPYLPAKRSGSPTPCLTVWTFPFQDSDPESVFLAERALALWIAHLAEVLRQGTIKHMEVRTAYPSLSSYAAVGET
jgi:hypothetical protein